MNSDNTNQSPNHPAVRSQAVPAEVYAARQFGKLLRAERITRGFTRDEVLAAMGLHPVHHAYILFGVESGDVELTVGQARMLDRKLGIPAPHLMAEVGLMDAHHLEPEDVPSAGRQITGPSVDTTDPKSFHPTAAAVLSFAAAALLILATITAIWGGGPWGVAAAIICGLGAWAALSVGFLSLWARASVRQWQLNAGGR
ncbi:hypothetical protein CRM73_00375 [Kocuria sp. CCUG 69068]|uniref:helix-turn-helix domain-containing protein n=1 Tax=Kocuria sp. CCUG 69068 TaxID=2043138 RepID=UPI001E4FA6F5|nr:hypothetical protein [Kocuria sp. CCUG 69068]